MPIRKNRIRLPAYDYAQSNHYYVTICTHLKEELFGKIADNNVILNESGKMVEQTLFESSEFYPGISIDQFVVMPNHVHAIIIIFNETNTLLDSNSVQEVSHKYSLSDIIHNIKSLTTKRYIDGVKNCNWK